MPLRRRLFLLAPLALGAGVADAGPKKARVVHFWRTLRRKIFNPYVGLFFAVAGVIGAAGLWNGLRDRGAKPGPSAH
ncbi:MAG TPA: hypothetical protein VHL79_23065 [Ramlibacter sp.]|jgi:hypothetical protein|nr:hypothetical protein [Ramlibacter sp.]